MSTAASIMTSAQRRAYIDTSRRSQPIEELERKAAKAKRRNRSAGMEGADLSLAVDHARTSAWYRREFTWLPIVFCSLCSAFGRGPWNEATKRYLLPPLHQPRCPHAWTDDGPYPGWSAVSSPLQSNAAKAA